MVNLDVLKQGIGSIIAETRCGVSSDLLYRIGVVVSEPNQNEERNYKDNYELIRPIPNPIGYLPVGGVPVSQVMCMLLYQGYFGNFPIYEVPPICYTHMRKDLVAWDDKLRLEVTVENVTNTINFVSRPPCTDAELYKAVYGLTAIRNELSLQACRLLGIRWEPQVSLVNRCFYIKSDSLQNVWQDDCNVLKASLYAFKDDFLRYAYATRIFEEWSKLNPNKRFIVQPMSILDMTEQEFNDLPGIRSIYSKSTTVSNPEFIVFDMLGRLCTCMRTIYQRITQTAINPCERGTVYGKTKWLSQLAYRLATYMAAQ